MPSIQTAPKNVVFSRDPILFEILTEKITNGESQEDNLSCYISFHTKKGITEKYVSSHNPPYYTATAIADIDVSRLLTFTPKPPVLTTTGISSVVEDSIFTTFLIKYADIFGTPPELEGTVTKSSEYTAIYGGTRYNNGLYTTIISPNPILLHAMHDETGQVIFKEVRKNQKEYIYFYTHSAGSGNLTATLYYSDGTNSSADLGSLTYAEKSVQYVLAGYDDLSLDTHLEAGKELAYYSLEIGGSSKLYYTIDDIENDEDTYWLYFNGCGGLEILRTSGFRKIKNNARRSVFERTSWGGQNFQDGTISHINARGNKSISVNTGYYSREYCKHLQQLIYGEFWKLDEHRQQYVRYLVENNSIEVADTMQDLYFVEFTCRPAFDEMASTNFHI